MFDHIVDDPPTVNARDFNFIFKCLLNTFLYFFDNHHLQLLKF